MNHRDYVETNRRMWNKTARVHAKAYVGALFERITSPGFTTFDAVEQSLFRQIGLADKAVAQLACNNGRELISVKKAGAGRCVGFDISDEFIDQAKKLAGAGGADVEFVRVNVYDIPSEYNVQFDLVYITIGVFGWLPDIDGFFDVISRLLKPGGQLFIYEMHPILNMYEAEQGLEVVSSYFRTEPLFEERGPDYFDPSQVVEGASYWFQHKLSDVIGACLDHGLNLTHFREYDHDISMVYANFEKLEKKPPLSYSLIARKPL
jgi:ubiquinone/menaquinone biosynthesis C-methylase UbiE